MLQKIALPPGVNRDLTQYALEGGGWYDTDKVRFRAGMPEKIGGWTKFISEAVVGIVRSMHVWRTLKGVVIVALGTEKKVYVVRNGELIDVTPVRRTAVLVESDVLTTTDGSSFIKVDDVAHGVSVGDYVTISNAVTFNGVADTALNAEHVVTSVISNQYYKFNCGDTASATGGSGATDITIEYQVEIGLAEATYGTGWGVCQYNTGSWNDTRTCEDILILGRIWSLDNWGEDLIMVPYGGSVYTWDASNPNDRGTLVEGAPTKVQFAKVTDDRHLACYGCNYSAASAQYAPSNIDPDELDTLRIEWSDQEDYNEWDIGDRLKTAGDFRITGGSQIISATKADSVMLVWTEEALHIQQAVDAPLVFRFDQLGTSTGIVAYNAHATHNGTTLWLGDSAFYSYSNGVAAVVCPVEEFMYEGMDYTYRRKVFAALNRRHDEISWYYPVEEAEDTALSVAATIADATIYVETTAAYEASGTLDVDGSEVTYTGKTDGSFTGCSGMPTAAIGAIVSTTDDPCTEPARYITFSLKENTWWIGRMERTAYVDRGMIEYGLGARPDGYIYEHEKGIDADGDPLTTYLESADFDIEEGEHLFFCDRFVPDFEMVGSLDIRLRTRYFPQSSRVEEVIGTVTPSTEFINARIRGRQASIAVKSVGLTDNWRWGACRIDIAPDGRKR